jgi:hypothetical protein
MKLSLKRKTFLSDRVLGELYIDGEYFCKTLEDAKREKKIAGETCIKAGGYNVAVNYSGAFKRDLPLLENVPEFSAIRIHAGNTPADTKGCILVGEYFDRNDDLRISRVMENRLVEKLRSEKEKHSIEIVETVSE